MKNILLVSIILVLSGCGVLSPRPPTVQATAPILVCPAPPNIVLPKLKISELTPSDKGNNHKIDAYYQASIEQLKSVVKNQKKIIDHYAELSKNYDAIAKQLKQKNAGAPTK